MASEKQGHGTQTIGTTEQSASARTQAVPTVETASEASAANDGGGQHGDGQTCKAAGDEWACRRLQAQRGAVFVGGKSRRSAARGRDDQEGAGPRRCADDWRRDVTRARARMRSGGGLPSWRQFPVMEVVGRRWRGNMERVINGHKSCSPSYPWASKSRRLGVCVVRWDRRDGGAMVHRDGRRHETPGAWNAAKRATTTKTAGRGGADVAPLDRGNIGESINSSRGMLCRERRSEGE
ncbi:hypothetical protein BKA81DRAFT_423362 [Phyllosticta paracitricarpa]|uniref:Uncharacterized protein n=1 Tax=Phyllosticta citricarpa TaxID=55181 RepID=A0ABR1L7F7_9PEZI